MKYHIWLDDLEDPFQSCKPKVIFKTVFIALVKFLVYVKNLHGLFL